MNWAALIAKIIALAQYTVVGIEEIHANETTETKTQLAQDALSIAVAGAAATLPAADAQIATALGQGVSSTITLTQRVIAAAKAKGAASTQITATQTPAS